jgi:hypothetical protein
MGNVERDEFTDTAYTSIARLATPCAFLAELSPLDKPYFK